jgi:hypothetical protein
LFIDISSLISSLTVLKPSEIQVDLFANELKDNSWRVWDFISQTLLDFDGETWKVELTKEQNSACFAEWKRGKKID